VIIPRPRAIETHEGFVAYDDARLDVRRDPAMRAEEYRIDARAAGVTLTAGGDGGELYGRTTLRALGKVPLGSIVDGPRFAWRGVMLDTARHFMPTEFVLRLVDLLAELKLNVLQLHLTDDQGWRVPIARYPRLTEVSGEHYAREDIATIVRHAAERNVTVVPEINVPGHVQAALAAYPELGNAPEVGIEVWRGWGISPHTLNLEPSTLSFFRHVLDEVVELFPSSYVHLGGDECLADEWAASPRALERIAELGLAGPHEARAWFTEQLAAHVESRGRRAAYWYEKPGGPAGVLAMTWLDEASGTTAALAGHDVVLTPHLRTYFDYPTHDEAGPFSPDRILPLENAYAFTPPTPAGAEDRVIGVQAQLWTEYLPTPDDVLRQAFPRLCAFAEVAWGTADDYDDFLTRLPSHLAHLGLDT